MPGGLEQRRLGDVRRPDLLVAVGAVHLEREVLHQLADEGTLGVEDRQAAADLRREVEEVELEPELAVVAAFRLGKPVEMRGERRLGLPGGAVDPLQLRAVLVAAPVRTGDAGQLEMAEAARPRYVRPAAQVDEVRAVAVRRHHRRARGGLGGELGVDPTVRRGDALDDLAFERLVGEEREPLLDRAHLADEGLVRGDDRAHRRLDRRQVLVGEAPVLGQLEVVVETVLDRRPDREARPGKRASTACAITCAVEWRRTARPSSTPPVTTRTTSPSWSTVPRSTRTPFTSATTASAASRLPIDAARSAAVEPGTSSRVEPSGTMTLIFAGLLSTR